MNVLARHRSSRGVADIASGGEAGDIIGDLLIAYLLDGEGLDGYKVVSTTQAFSREDSGTFQSRHRRPRQQKRHVFNSRSFFSGFHSYTSSTRKSIANPNFTTSNMSFTPSVTITVPKEYGYVIPSFQPPITPYLTPISLLTPPSLQLRPPHRNLHPPPRLLARRPRRLLPQSRRDPLPATLRLHLRNLRRDRRRRLRPRPRCRHEELPLQLRSARTRAVSRELPAVSAGVADCRVEVAGGGQCVGIDLECGEGGVCDWVYEAGFEEREGQVVWVNKLYWTVGAVDFDGEDGVGYDYGLSPRRDVSC